MLNNNTTKGDVIHRLDTDSLYVVTYVMSVTLSVKRLFMPDRLSPIVEGINKDSVLYNNTKLTYKL